MLDDHACSWLVLYMCNFGSAHCAVACPAGAVHALMCEAAYDSSVAIHLLGCSLFCRASRVHAVDCNRGDTLLVGTRCSDFLLRLSVSAA